MKLGDILALAKQGYKPGDIRELLELAQSTEEPEPKDEAAKLPDQDKDEPDHAEPPVDYEALYKEQLAKTEELTKTVAEIQKANLDALKNTGDNKDTDESIFLDALKNWG